ncbi:LacI family DNA-binding transcriptional regulator [Cryptosporangium sp. NPDC051539]|uniref:LacI family DNA-binding transcriptional regulator n=1 Tax=Cryptosporangium sp. NPDC051539 TaxID=3363962 RepID=UPI00379D4E80
MAERATIHDVARAAGVSHQTVSNVLNGRARVGAAARDRVNTAIDELGYRPHAGAASLRTRRAGRLAYPLTASDHGPTNTIMLEFLQALTSAAARHGRHLVLAEDGPDDRLAGVLRLVRSGEVDGVVLTNVVADDPRVAVLSRARVPFACFGRTGAGQPQCWVDVDNRAGTRVMTERLVGFGHERVAFLGYAPQGRWDEEREAGYRDAMRSAGLRPQVSTPDPEGPDVARAITRLLESPASAIVTGSDVLAAALCAAATARGLTLGPSPSPSPSAAPSPSAGPSADPFPSAGASPSPSSDRSAAPPPPGARAAALAVTGFDGSVVGRLLTPALTTVAIPLPEIAERVVRRVLAEIDGPTTAGGEILAPGLIEGSTG